MNIQAKQAQVDELKSRFLASNSAFLLEFKKSTCKELTQLRRELGEKGARFAVVKNTLAKRAIAETTAEGLSKMFSGPTAVVWLAEDPVSPARVLKDFLKGKETLSIKGGVVDGQVVDGQGVAALADLPSKEELQARLLAQINAPATQLLRTINAPAEQLVRVIEAWRKKLEERA